MVSRRTHNTGRRPRKRETTRHRILELGIDIRLYRDKLSANWRFRLRRKGYPIINNKSTGTSERDLAKVLAQKFILQLVGGRSPKDLSLEWIFDKWLAVGGRFNQMEESTKAGHRTRIRKIVAWCHSHGITRFNQIDYNVATQLLQFLQKQELSKKSIRHHLEVLKSVSTWAFVGPEYTSEDKLRKFRPPPLKLSDRKGTRAYTADEMVRILEALKVLPEPLYVASLLLYFVGARLSDVCRLRVRDIEIEESKRGQSKGSKKHVYVNIVVSKSKNPRRNLIRQPWLQKLVLDQVKGQKPDEPLLSWPSAKGGINRLTLSRKYSKIIRNLGITDVRSPGHALRHTFGTNLAIEHGVSLPVLQTLMGHRDMATTRQYISETQADLDLAISKLQSPKNP